MDYEAVMEEIGGFGKFQIKILLLVCLPVLFCSSNTVSYVFISRTPLHRCFIPECDEIQDVKFNQEWLKHALPGSVTKETFVPEGCYRYNFIGSSNNTDISRISTCTADLFGKEWEKCNRWVFAEDEVTIVNEWPEKLACSENEWKLALVGTANFAGVMIGSAIVGFLADSYGRRKVFAFSIVFMSLTGIGQAVSNSYIMLIIFTFLNAAGTTGIYIVAFVLIIEMLDKSRREMSSVLLYYIYSFGGVLVGVIAFFDRNWRNLTLWIAAPPIIFIINYWLIPESICWLISTKSYANAYKVVKKVAKANKKQLSTNMVAQFEGTINSAKNSSMDSLNHLSDSESHTKTSYLTLLKSRKLLIRILVLCYIWGTNTLVFYGLSLYSVNLSGNIYLNFIFGSLIEIPGTTIAWITMNKIGRRHPLALSFIICGIGCVCGAFVRDHNMWLQILLFLVGKMAITSSFTINFVYTAEMMPTTLRSGSVGSFSTIARLSSLLAPFVPLLKNYYSFLPLVVFGSFALAAGFLSFLLPETLGCNLPDTLSEAEEIGT